MKKETLILGLCAIIVQNLLKVDNIDLIVIYAIILLSVKGVSKKIKYIYINLLDKKFQLTSNHPKTQMNLLRKRICFAISVMNAYLMALKEFIYAKNAHQT